MVCYNIERKNIIMDKISTTGKVSIAELVDEFHVTKETLRRDLTALEKEGLLKRTHGGAIQIESKQQEKTLQITQREKINYKEKDRICKKAASFVENGDCIFIDNSTTNISLLKYINPEYKITVITNSIWLLLELSRLNNENFTVISLGGIFRQDNFSCVGNFAHEMAQRFFPNKAFISARGINFENEMYEIYDMSMYEVDVKRAFIENSEKVYLTADHTKLGAKGGTKLTLLKKIDYLICDQDVIPAQKKIFSDLQIEVIVSA